MGTGFHPACRALSLPLEGTVATLKAIVPGKNSGGFLSWSPQKPAAFKMLLCVSPFTLKVCYEQNNTLLPSQAWGRLVSGNSCCKLSIVPAYLCFINEMWLQPWDFFTLPRAARTFEVLYIQLAPLLCPRTWFTCGCSTVVLRLGGRWGLNSLCWSCLFWGELKRAHGWYG